MTISVANCQSIKTFQTYILFKYNIFTINDANSFVLVFQLVQPFCSIPMETWQKPLTKYIKRIKIERLYQR